MLQPCLGQVPVPCPSLLAVGAGGCHIPGQGRRTSQKQPPGLKRGLLERKRWENMGEGKGGWCLGRPWSDAHIKSSSPVHAVTFSYINLALNSSRPGKGLSWGGDGRGRAWAAHGTPQRVGGHWIWLPRNFSGRPREIIGIY